MSDFSMGLPYDPSDLVYSRQRIGEYGVALILAAAAQLHGKTLTLTGATGAARHALSEARIFGPSVYARLRPMIFATYQWVCGWAKPDRVELSATDTLADFINSIRKAQSPRHPVMADYAEDNGERR